MHLRELGSSPADTHFEVQVEGPVEDGRLSAGSGPDENHILDASLFGHLVVDAKGAKVFEIGQANLLLLLGWIIQFLDSPLGLG